MRIPQIYDLERALVQEVEGIHTPSTTTSRNMSSPSRSADLQIASSEYERMRRKALLWQNLTMDLDRGSLLGNLACATAYKRFSALINVRYALLAVMNGSTASVIFLDGKDVGSYAANTHLFASHFASFCERIEMSSVCPWRIVIAIRLGHFFCFGYPPQCVSPRQRLA